MKKLALLAAVAAVSIGAYAPPSEAAAVTMPPAEIGAAHAITESGCVIRVHRHWVRRHIRPDGVVVPGHWVRRRVKVCD